MANLSAGDANHALVRAFDEPSDSLKTTITNATVDISVSAFTDSIAIADNSGNKATTTLVGSKRGLDVNIVDLTLDKSNDSVSTENYDQSVRIDETDGTTAYFGYAAVGSSESSSVWKIKRIHVSGATTSVTYADGNINYDNSWTNRASLTYL